MLHQPKAQAWLTHDSEPVAIVIPAFEQVAGTKLPTNLEELQSNVDRGVADGFHLSYFPQGHAPTDYDRFWKTSSSSDSWDALYSIEYQTRFEPYIVANSACIPLYDERFCGYGLNKISHLRSVAETCQFAVLPGVFLVAREHERSPAWHDLYGDSTSSVTAREHLQALYDDFVERVVVRNGQSPVVSDVTAALSSSSSSSRRENPLRQMWRRLWNKLSSGSSSKV